MELASLFVGVLVGFVWGINYVAARADLAEVRKQARAKRRQERDLLRAQNEEHEKCTD
jgi:hypothetical protein